MHLSPFLSRWACCFCLVSQNRSEVISFLKGRKHLRVLCYMNNKCSCPQALVQVVNKLVNYIEINAIGIDLKLCSPCIDSVLPAAGCAPRPRSEGSCWWAAPPATAAPQLSVRPPQAMASPGRGADGGFKLYPLPQASSQKLGHRDLGQPEESRGCLGDFRALVQAGWQQQR